MCSAVGDPVPDLQVYLVPKLSAGKTSPNYLIKTINNTKAGLVSREPAGPAWPAEVTKFRKVARMKKVPNIRVSAQLARREQKNALA